MKDLLKILLGIGLAGGGWFLFSSFRNKPLLPSPDDEPQNTDVGDKDQYAVDLWAFGILKAGPGWAKQIKAEAQRKGISFEKQLREVAIAKYVEKNSLPEEPIPTYFENAIRRKIIAMKLNPSWMKTLQQKATQNNLTIDEQMRKSAIWHVLNDLMKPYINNGGGVPNQNPNPGGHPDDNHQQNGQQGVGAVIMSI